MMQAGEMIYAIIETNKVYSTAVTTSRHLRSAQEDGWQVATSIPLDKDRMMSAIGALKSIITIDGERDELYLLYKDEAAATAKRERAKEVALSKLTLEERKLLDL